MNGCPRLLGVALAVSVCFGCSDDDAGASAPAGAAGEPASAPAGSARESASTSTADAARADSKSPASPAPSKEQRATAEDGCGKTEFSSTFAAIQEVIFEKGSCTNSQCHGEAKSGGLDLRPDAAYDSLIQVKSSNSSLLRVMPGVPGESFLFNKLRAATEPGSIKVEGSPMPSGAPALPAEHLEAVRRWIEAGAPREGSIGDTITGRSDEIGKLLGACLPKASPVQITALPPPAKDEGVQLVMAPFPLRGGTEVDVCFAQYYDLTDVVPREYQNPEKGVFFVDGQRVRQDPNSHHFSLVQPDLGADAVNDPSFGSWTCRGGDSKGQSCDPLKKDVCGSGQCASEVKNVSACIGFGPQGKVSAAGRKAVATAQTAQYYRAPRDGVYEEFPLRGILYWNSHAFNLTSEETTLDVWVNLFYAKNPKQLIKTLGIADKISIAEGQPPYTVKNYCSTWVAPRGSRMYQLGSHTHKRGRNFTVDMADHKRIYTSALYSDPVEEIFDPPLAFDAEDPADRTLTYCADFNNGVNADGSPNVDLVTKLSTMPDRTTCQPVACVAGKLGAACKGRDDNAACDSHPGAGDGKCDACPITGGQTTENEMFVLSPSIVVP